MPEIQYPTNPNTDTVFVVQEDGKKNRALMVAPQDISTLELSNNPNSTKGYVTIDGKKHRVNLVADITGGGGDQHNLGYYATQAALEEAHPTAEAGDWAIVGATDTVWIWDTDTSAWVDSDQKGQVTSVNGQTGAVTVSEVPSQTGYSGRVLGTDGFVAGWVVPEKVQRSTMPQASEDELGNIYQFTGTTDANYTNGYFYKCVSDGQNPATYSWEEVSLGSGGGLPDQTGQSGKFLTTDGTDASWSDKPLVNKRSISDGNIVVGDSSTGASGYNSIVLGAGASTLGSGCVLIGTKAKAGAASVIQICAGYAGNGATNSDANTFKVANTNGNFEIMSADGTVPTARLTKVNTTATLAVADWSSNTQTVTVSGVKADSVVFVSPAPASASDYASAGILCTAQAADSLTFSCTQTPSNAITVNVICM